MWPLTIIQPKQVCTSWVQKRLVYASLILYPKRPRFLRTVCHHKTWTYWHQVKSLAKVERLRLPFRLHSITQITSILSIFASAIHIQTQHQKGNRKQARTISWPVTNTNIPPPTDGCESKETTRCWHDWNGNPPNFSIICCDPTNFWPSKVSNDCCWYNPARPARLLSKVE